MRVVVPFVPSVVALWWSIRENGLLSLSGRDGRLVLPRRRSSGSLVVQLLAAVALCLSGCSCSPSTRDAGVQPPPAEHAVPPSSPDASQEPPGREPPRVAPTGSVTLGGRVVEPRQVVMVVDNGTAEPLRVRRALTVERETGETWTARDDIGDLWLRNDCQPVGGVMFWEGGAQECVEVAPGGSFESVPWSGNLGDAQCMCERCVPAPAGRYRFVAQRCDGGRLEGAPFDLRGSEAPPAGGSRAPGSRRKPGRRRGARPAGSRPCAARRSAGRGPSGRPGARASKW